MQRSPEEVKRRARLILSDSEIVSLVNESSSPSAAYDLVFDETNKPEIAKAARWLAILRRDYIKDYEQLTQTTLRHANKSTAHCRKE